jgi:SWI/SNF-related matrix-associated actin-dependent regulator 1 of chromatin subfamily A
MTTLFPYQHEAIKSINSFDGRSLLALDMGLGKTRIALEWIRQNNPSTLPALIICPASVKYYWEHEAVNSIKIRPSICETQTPPIMEHVIPQRMYVINYDILIYWLAFLRPLGFQTVVIDESQYLANPRTKRTRAVKEICRGVPNILALSGTPLLNRPIELHPTLNILDRKRFPSRRVYGDEYCAPKWTPWGIKYTGVSKSRQLHKLLLDSCMIRYRKQDVLTELPEKSREVVILPLTRPEEYQRASENFITWLKEQNPEKARRAMRAESLAKLGYLKRLSAKLKLKYAVDWINQFLEDSDEKLVVFAVHRGAIEVLKKRCKAKSVVMSGAVTGRKRDAAVKQFQTDKKTRLLIGNIRAAGVGITLTAASTVVFVELDWRPGDHTQAEDRCHRLTQRMPVQIFYLIAKDTIEVEWGRLIQKKQETLSAVLDGEKTGKDLPLFDELMKRMRK